MSESQDREDLLTGGFLRRWGTWTRTKIVGVALIFAVVLATVVTTSVVLTRPEKSVVVPTTQTPFSPSPGPTSGPTGTTTITTTTPTPTEMPTTTKISTTTVTPTTTQQTPTTTTTLKPSPITEDPTTTTQTPKTTTKEPTTTTPPTPVTAPTPPFHPTTLKPLPTNVTDYPPVSLLIDMGMRPKFIQINCLASEPPTFKYVVEILGTRNYTGVAKQKELAKTASAMTACEAIFDLHYPSPIPPPKNPCHEDEASSEFFS